MVELLHSHFAGALGWTLVDSLWQTGTLWGMYSVLTANGKKFSAPARHNLALFLLSAGILWFFASFAIALTATGGNHSNLYSVSHLFAEGRQNNQAYFSWLNNALPFLSAVYLLAVSGYSVRLYLHTVASRLQLSKSIQAVPESLQLSIDGLCKRLNIRRNVSLKVSGKAPAPLTTGILKPLILLPVSAVTQLTFKQIEAIVAHELAHIKRYDYLLNYIVVCADILLFFNPFARILSNIIRKEREDSCDDKVLSLGYDAWEYSQALYHLGRSGETYNSLALAATGNGKQLLLNRIKRLLRIELPSVSIVKPVCLFFLCLLLAGLSSRSPSVPHISATEVETTTILVAHTTVVADNAETMVTATPKLYDEKKSAPVVLPETTKKDTPAASGHIEEAGPEDPSSLTSTREETILINIPTFVSNEESIEFTFIIPELTRKPQAVISESPLPYVPASTFYCPVDSLPVAVSDREVIHI